MTLERVQYPAALHVRDGGDGRTLEGPLLPWGVEARVHDRGRQVVETFDRGALAGVDPARVPLMRTHPRGDPGMLPIGVTTELEERADAAWGAWHVSDTALGNEVLALAHDGVPLGLSVGFLEVPGGSRWLSRTRVVRTRAQLDHVAVVRVPAYKAPGWWVCAPGRPPLRSCSPGQATHAPMTRTLLRTCVDCGRSVRGRSRCNDCQRAHQRAKRARRPDLHNDAAERERRRRVVADHRALVGDWCPGWGRQPAHQSADLTADHVEEVAKGGRPDGRLVVRCRSCNSAKAAAIIARALAGSPQRAGQSTPRPPRFPTHTAPASPPSVVA
jgi:5-methylcytosine-specific restriction enzyme A